jgi:hypothetical protein
MATPGASRSHISGPQRRMIQLAFDAFDGKGEWPKVATLQHQLAKKGDSLQIRLAGRDLDRSVGHADVISVNGEVTLTIKGLKLCQNSEQALADFV